MEHYATAQQVFAAGLIFARLGTMVMLMPAIGENFVPIRIRLAFSFALMLMLFPILSAAIPTLPTTVSGVAGAVIKEFAIGLLIGSVLRFFMSSLASAGEPALEFHLLIGAENAAAWQRGPRVNVLARAIAGGKAQPRHFGRLARGIHDEYGASGVLGK